MKKNRIKFFVEIPLPKFKVQKLDWRHIVLIIIIPIMVIKGDYEKIYFLIKMVVNVLLKKLTL